MPAKLFVGNLSFQATEEDLRELFQQAGNVETVRIITDQFTGRPRGFGFVEMATKEEATKAVEMLNGRLFRDRNLVVDEARPQPQRSGGGGDRGGGGRGPRPGGAPGGGGGWRR
jgi:cold-inducible RNA-binding protein